MWPRPPWGWGVLWGRPGPGAVDYEAQFAGLPIRRSAYGYPLDRGVRQSTIRGMGFNRRKMEDQRRGAAEKEATTRRATDAQVLEDAERLITAWNERRAARP